MYQETLCMNTNNRFGVPIETQIRMMHDAGFDGFFTAWDDHTADYRRLADELGMLYQSIHSPTEYVTSLWSDCAEAETGIHKLTACLEDCAANGVEIMICHLWCGYDDPPGPTAVGLRNYEKLVRAAERTGVKIAFENAEQTVYLDAVLDAFGDSPFVGYCWDAGHERCYCHGEDLLARHGKHLIATHINDNLGIRDRNGALAFADDIHLLPFDGIIDWQEAVQRLARIGYDGVLTLEVKRPNQEGRRTNDKYLRMAPEEYFAEAYGRACRLAAMRDRLLRGTYRYEK